MRRLTTIPRLLVILIASSLLTGCSLRRLAVNQVGNALAEGGAAFSTDDDPELVGAAVPFGLKLMESFLAESPNHRPLLVASLRGFTQYSYGWISHRADEMEPIDLAAAAALRRRARGLYLRARDYGLRALDESAQSVRE